MKRGRKRKEEVREAILETLKNILKNSDAIVTRKDIWRFFQERCLKKDPLFCSKSLFRLVLDELAESGVLEKGVQLVWTSRVVFAFKQQSEPSQEKIYRVKNMLRSVAK